MRRRLSRLLWSPSQKEFEATRKACALAIAKHENALTSHRAMKEIWVTRAVIEQSRDLMARVDAALARRA